MGIVYVYGDSMLPTYENGDVLIIKKWSTPQRGEVVTAYIEELDRTVLKRVLAMEGDRVRITQSSVFLNGQQIMEIGEMEIDVEKEFTVPAKHYFVIGDNHLVSVDSREFGCVSKCNIQGIVISKIF